MKPEDVSRVFQSEDYKAAAEKGVYDFAFISCSCWRHKFQLRFQIDTVKFGVIV